MLKLKQKLRLSSGNELVPSLPRPVSPSPFAGKVMLVAFWDSRGIILAHVMPKGRTMIARHYSVVILKHLKDKTEKKLRPRLAQKKCHYFA